MFFRVRQDVDRSCAATLAKWQSGSLYRLLRFSIAAVLFVAALLKAHQLATTPSLGDGLLHNRWLNILVVEFEILFATWLVTGILPRLAWFVSTCCFTTFAIVSLTKGIAGETSCGCFGAQEVNPWLTFGLDIMIVAALLLCRPILSYSALWYERSEWRRLVPVTGIWALISLPLLYGMTSVHFPVLDENISLTGDEETSITLEPMRWLGKPFRLADALEATALPDNWKQGVWQVLLHHQGCAICEKVLNGLATKAGTVSFDRLAVIEVPDGEAVKLPEEIQNRAGFVSSLRRNRTWFAPSPVLVVIQDGIVMDVKVGSAVLEVSFVNK